MECVLYKNFNFKKFKLKIWHAGFMQKNRVIIFAFFKQEYILSYCISFMLSLNCGDQKPFDSEGK